MILAAREHGIIRCTLCVVRHVDVGLFQLTDWCRSRPPPHVAPPRAPRRRPDHECRGRPPPGQHAHVIRGGWRQEGRVGNVAVAGGGVEFKRPPPTETGSSVASRAVRHRLVEALRVSARHAEVVREE